MEDLPDSIVEDPKNPVLRIRALSGLLLTCETPPLHDVLLLALNNHGVSLGAFSMQVVPALGKILYLEASASRRSRS